MVRSPANSRCLEYDLGSSRASVLVVVIVVAVLDTLQSEQDMESEFLDSIQRTSAVAPKAHAGVKVPGVPDST